MSESNLLRCPFCGGVAQQEDVANDDGDYRRYFVVCRSCGAESGWAKTERGAIRNWQSRYSPIADDYLEDIIGDDDGSNH